MSSQRKKRLTFSLFVATSMTIALWLFHSDDSPLYQYSIWHSTPGNILGYLSFPAVIVGILASNNVHQPSVLTFYVAAFLQWFGLAFLCSLALFRRA
jgi:hypothetical protein